MAVHVRTELEDENPTEVGQVELILATSQFGAQDEFDKCRAMVIPSMPAEMLEHERLQRRACVTQRNPVSTWLQRPSGQVEYF